MHVWTQSNYNACGGALSSAFSWKIGSLYTSVTYEPERVLYMQAIRSRVNRPLAMLVRLVHVWYASHPCGHVDDWRPCIVGIMIMLTCACGYERVMRWILIAANRMSSACHRRNYASFVEDDCDQVLMQCFACHSQMFRIRKFYSRIFELCPNIVKLYDNDSHAHLSIHHFILTLLINTHRKHTRHI